MDHPACHDFCGIHAFILDCTEPQVVFEECHTGAIFATLGWILVSLAFSYYVSSFANYSATYGSIGGIIVLMMWLYFSGTILMVGGQINAVMQERKEKLAMKKAGAVV